MIDNMMSQSKGSSLSKNGIDVKVTKLLQKWLTFQTAVVWPNVIGFAILHLMALVTIKTVAIELYNLRFGTFIYGATLAFMAGLGITMGAHRLWSHRTFKANLPLEIILIFCQTLASQNCLYIWARDHRQHHKFTDTNADPHNASRGFFFSHMGWLMLKKHPDVITKGQTLDLSDLEANPVVMFQKKYYNYLYTLTTIIVVAIPVCVWNESLWYSFMGTVVLRSTIVLHITWNVNSSAHFFGTKPFDKNIMPSENFWVSWFGLGEGWHNYHHAFPWDYKAAEIGSGANVTRSIIEFCARHGWTYDLRSASEPMVKTKASRSGDGSFAASGKHILGS